MPPALSIHKRNALLQKKLQNSGNCMHSSRVESGLARVAIRCPISKLVSESRASL